MNKVNIFVQELHNVVTKVRSKYIKKIPKYAYNIVIFF